MAKCCSPVTRKRMSLFLINASHFWPESALFMALPLWAATVMILTAYIHCIQDHTDNSVQNVSSFQKSRTQFTDLVNGIIPKIKPHIKPLYGEVESEFPELDFQPEYHGVQVFVHTILATDMVLKPFDITWVTQLTSDRLDIFSQMMKRWNGPASVTLYCRDLKKDLRAIEPFRSRVDFHLVLADFHPGRLYPVNTLRNVAINKCRSNWMMLVDADFVPSQDLYEYLLPFLPAWEKSESAVYVVPAFQLQHGEHNVPLTKEDLLAMGDRVSPVHPEAGRDIAHKHTDYPRWREAGDPYDAEYRMPYEPYFAANKRVPRYDVNFLGYGNDKTEHCLEVFEARMRFRVLPRPFVFHVDHPPGQWQRGDSEWLVRAPDALSRFVTDVHRRYHIRVDDRAEPVAGEAGDNCTAVCLARGRGCRADLAAAVNTCEAMVAAFGASRCGGDACRRDMYGHDLPAFNPGMGSCLLNGKPEEYPTACAVGPPQSARLCPCGEPLAQWLTTEYVREVLSREGGWQLPSSMGGPAPT